jgi:hypothetical protein
MESMLLTRVKDAHKCPQYGCWWRYAQGGDVAEAVELWAVDGAVAVECLIDHQLGA